MQHCAQAHVNGTPKKCGSGKEIDPSPKHIACNCIPSHSHKICIIFAGGERNADLGKHNRVVEFNQQQHSPSADVTKTAVTFKRDALLLLASNSNVLEKQVNMDIFYQPVTLLKTLIEISELSHKTIDRLSAHLKKDALSVPAINQSCCKYTGQSVFE